MKTLKFEQQTFTPGKIVCVGRNYLEHIHELGNEEPQQMVIFCKPNSAISHRLISFQQEPLHFESEICFMVADNKLSGVGVGLDLTKRGLQSELKGKGLPWERAKAFDGAASFSDFVSLDNISIESLSLELEINGELRQQGGYELMMHKPDQVLQGIQEFMTLDTGDIIMTGTPKGVGQVSAGDQFTGRILSNRQPLLHHSWLAE